MDYRATYHIAFRHLEPVDGPLAETYEFSAVDDPEAKHVAQQYLLDIYRRMYHPRRSIGQIILGEAGAPPRPDQALKQGSISVSLDSLECIRRVA